MKYHSWTYQHDSLLLALFIVFQLNVSKYTYSPNTTEKATETPKYTSP